MTEIEKDPSNQKDNQQAPLIPQDNVVKTRHTLKLGEKTLDYTVTTGGHLF